MCNWFELNDCLFKVRNRLPKCLLCGTD